MSRVFSILAALLLMAGAGFGISMSLLRNSRRIAIAELIGLSWLLGTAAVSLGLWLLSAGLRGLSLQITVTVIALALSVIGVALVRKKQPQFPQSMNWIEYALAVFLCLEIGLVFVLTFKHTLGWDGLLIWELKARYAYLNGGALPTAYFSDATRAFSHPEYPLYLPMIEMWLYFWIGEPNQFWVKLIFPVFYAAGMLLLAQAGAALSGKRWIGLLMANLFLFVPFLTRAAGGIVLGYADIPLSIFYLAAFYFLWIFAREDSRPALSIFLVLSAILPWVKREGAILWLVLAACSLPLVFRRRGVLFATLTLLPGVVMIAGWQIYLHWMHARPAQDFLPLSPPLLVTNFYRLGPVLQKLIEEATTIDRWNLLWFMTPLALLSFALRNRSRRALLLVVCLVAPLGLYCLTYLFSAWPDYLHHVESSLPRLLLHVAPLSILAIALALAQPQRSCSRLPAD